ncbi:MAG: ABC transporter ATP-binding protein, partial [Spirochaetota bacterium]
LKAVDDVNFFIEKGETLGVVGESGCGKSTLARTMIRLYEPTGGDVYFKDENIANMNKEKLLKTRRHFQIIFQDPYASLNPRITVGDIIAEPLWIYKKRGLVDKNKKEIKEEVKGLLDTVGLSPKFINRYPHEFSGGQRQRIGVARALALRPDLILCDEPVSALDVSIQSQILNLLERLQNEYNLTYMFIAHDLAVVKHISDRIAVMYLGKIVEIAKSNEIYGNSLHPYSKALLSAIPIPNPQKERQRQRIILKGDVPSPDKEFIGCNFKDRCFLKTEICEKEEPPLEDKGDGHYSACHHYDKCKEYSIM